MSQAIDSTVEYDITSILMKREVELDPLQLIHGGCLRIVNKQGDLIRLIPSMTQQRLLKVVAILRRRAVPIRIHALKARQVYFSTCVEAIFYSIASQTANVHGVVIADDDDGSSYLFGMQRTMQEEAFKEMPWLVEKTRRNNEQKIEWERLKSWIMTDTANNLKAGRKYTFQLVHLSESAFFRDYETLTTGLFQSVPSEPNTMVIDESTANGMAGGFYNAVMASYLPHGQWDEELEAWVGPNGWVLLFIPWYEHPEYMMRGKEEEVLDGIHFASLKERREFMEHEEVLREVIAAHHRRVAQRNGTEANDTELHSRVEAQLRWRRWKIKHDCKGDPRVFDQEYPDSVDTAFLASGRPALNAAVVTKNLKLSRFTRPKFIGNLEWSNEWKSPADGRIRFGPQLTDDRCINYGDLTVKWVEDPHGRWHLWRHPEVGWINRYCIGSDVAEGLEQGDQSTGRILDRALREPGAYVEVVASFMGLLDTDLFAEELVKAAIYYQEAVLGIERNNHGLSVIKRAFQMYKRFYVRQDYSKGWPETTDQIGWTTLEGTKKDMIDALNEWLRKEHLRDPETEFWSQARTFVRDARGRLGAQGKREDPATKVYDDAVIAEAIMLQVHLWMPPPTQMTTPVTGWRKRALEKGQPKGALAL